MQSWIKINTNTVIHNLFLYFINLHVLRKSDLHLKKDVNQFWFEKILDLHLIKMQISFCLRKLRSTSKEDVNLFLYWEKLRSTSYQDADLFLYWEKFRSTSYKDADLLFFKKNNCSHANLLTFKKKDYKNHIKNNHALTKQQLTIHFMDIWKKERDITCIITSQEKKWWRKQPLAWAHFVLERMF